MDFRWTTSIGHWHKEHDRSSSFFVQNVNTKSTYYTVYIMKTTNIATDLCSVGRDIGALVNLPCDFNQVGILYVQEVVTRFI